MDTASIETICQLLREGKPLPAHLRDELFPPERKPMEYELTYGCKEREEDILADTWSVPFQPVKSFGEPTRRAESPSLPSFVERDVAGKRDAGRDGDSALPRRAAADATTAGTETPPYNDATADRHSERSEESQWVNKLIFGDNLQALKHLMNDPQVKGRVKLVYIDPPFATKQEFQGARGERAYADKVAGAEFLEFLRKRLIFLRELLAEDGSIFVHLDWKKGHYVRALMDEIFGESNFKNEIIWYYENKLGTGGDVFDSHHDTLYVYGKSSGHVYNPQFKPVKVQKLQPVTQKVEGKRVWLRDDEGKRIYAMSAEIRKVGDVWEIPIINPVASERIGFPTQKPEALLECAIKSFSNEGDIVLDCFAGSGTTAAVAEKLGRRWIAIDSSKFAVYTMQKRMLSLKAEIGNKGKSLKPKPFVLYNAGLYEYDRVQQLPADEYKRFAAELFQVNTHNPPTLSGYAMDGVLRNCPVRIYTQSDSITEETIDALHKAVGHLLNGKTLYLIAPANRVYFLQDIFERDGATYVVLRIPYSIVDELHKGGFRRLKQPTSESDINQIVDAVGFDFIYPPMVECEYFAGKDGLLDALCVKITSFEPVQITRKPVEFSDWREALAAVFVDRNYNGEVFNLTDTFWGDAIRKDDMTARIPADGLGERLMMVFMDVLGNERREVKRRGDFHRRVESPSLPSFAPQQKQRKRRRV